MFRAAVSELDTSEGWVKCGHCRKVFDCRKNEIKPADFVKDEQPSEDELNIDENAEQVLDAVSSSNTAVVEDEQFVPQIALFEEPEQPEITNLDTSDTSFQDPAVVGSQRTEKHSDAVSEPASGKHPLGYKKSDYKIADANLSSNDVGTTGLQVDSRPIGQTALPAAGSDNSNYKIEPAINPQSEKQTRVKSQSQSQSKLKNRLNVTKPQAPRFSAIILAKAQSWKKQRNRFKKTKAFPFVLIAVALFAMLIWQIAIVNYTRLSQYKFLSAPLAAVCSIVTCNQAAAPQASGFEILHASVRRHANVPNVMSVSATLINFSDENKLMPTLRLDLTNDANAIIASRTIELPENPDYVEPALTQLAPGQDVQLMFNIENPDKSAHGFQLSLVAREP